VDLTKEDWSEWKSHPCTVAACKDINDKIEESKEGLQSVRFLETSDEIARDLVFRMGVWEGAKALLEVIEERTDED
jgi:hypothetical protein